MERKYSQVEREALAVVYGCERFHLYLFGKPFKIITDARAIAFIYGNTKTRIPARIERWGLRLMPYDFCIEHKPSKENIADFLSRHPVEPFKDEHEWDDNVNFIASHALPKALSREQLILETSKDAQLVELRKLIGTVDASKRAKDAEATKPFAGVVQEMTVTSDGLVLRNHLIVVPRSLRDRVVALAHEGHQGEVKTKQLLREKVWFPNLDQLVAQKVKACMTCQLSSDQGRHMEPLVPAKASEKVWDELSVDFFGPLPSGDYIFVLVDDLSRFRVVEVVRSTSAEMILPKLEGILSTFGIPSVIRSDNGPPFNSRAFSELAEVMGFKHRKITPEWPTENAKGS